MTLVSFALRSTFEVPAERLWSALIDWEAHGTWIPATRSRILSGDGGLGTRFVAVTGMRPFALEDRMEVVRFEPATLSAEVVKLGPVLRGTAGFSVSGNSVDSALEWHEAVTVPLLPAFLAPAAAAVGRVLFGIALRRLGRLLR